MPAASADNASGIGDNASGTGDNASGTGDNASGIGRHRQRHRRQRQKVGPQSPNPHRAGVIRGTQVRARFGCTGPSNGASRALWGTADSVVLAGFLTRDAQHDDGPHHP
jgi:hypothetical protein